MHPKLLFFVDFLISLLRLSDCFSSRWFSCLHLEWECLWCYDKWNAANVYRQHITSAVLFSFSFPLSLHRVPCFPIFNLLLDRRPFTSVLCWRMWQLLRDEKRKTKWKRDTFIDVQSVVSMRRLWRRLHTYYDGHRFPFWKCNLLCHIFFLPFFSFEWNPHKINDVIGELTKTLISGYCALCVYRTL